MIEQSKFLSAEHEQQIRDFTLYANFISNQFDIQVVLDTHQAHTDGKVISLPNVVDLTPDELNAMYAILLHEAGHIRHSDFSDAYFSQLKTELQAFFANCFEDARIENILCTEFDGAKNMFEQLYTVHAINPAINYRLFGFHKRNGDDAFSFGAFLHNIKCNFASADIIDIDPRSKKIVNFLQKNLDFIEQIQNHPLKTPQDSLDLSKIAYEFFTKKFKDITNNISINEDKKVLDKLKSNLDELSNTTKILEENLEVAFKERKDKENEYRKSMESVAAELESLKASSSTIKKALSSTNDFYRALQQLQKSSEKMTKNIKRNKSSEKIQNEDMNAIARRFEKIQSVQKPLSQDQKVAPSKSFEEVKQHLENNIKPNLSIEKTGNEEVDKKIEQEMNRLNSSIDSYINRDNSIRSRQNDAVNQEQNIQKQLQEMKKSFEKAKQSTPFIPPEFKQDHLKDLANMKEHIDHNEHTNINSVKESLAQSNDDTQDSSADEQDEFDVNNEQGSQNGSQQSAQNGQNSAEGQANDNEGEGSDGEESNFNGDSLTSRYNELQSKISEIEKPFSALKEAVSNARANEQKIQSEIESAISEAFMKTMEHSNHGNGNGGKGNNQSQLPFEHPMDMLFQNTPGWESSDNYQKDFDKRATQETKSLIVNGEKIAGSGRGNRSISVLLNNIKNDVEAINLADCFKDVYAGSMMEQHNQAGFENFGAEKGRAINTDSYIASFATTGKHTVLSTQFDNIEMLNHIESKENETRKILSERHILVNQIKEELKKKMKVTKKPRFVGAKDEGDLDSRNLWKIPARRGSDVFEQNNPKFINNVAASIVVDISGSLNNDSTKEGKEIKFIVGALSEALQNCYVNHEVLGYHAPYSDELAAMKIDESYNRRNHYLETVVFKNFKQKDNAGIDNLELQSSDNSDGESLRIAMKRLLQQRAKNRVLFMITDAKPFLTGANVLKLDKDLYEALQEAKRKKIQIVGIGFNSDKTGIFGKNFLHIKDNSYQDLIECIKKLELRVD